MALLERIKRKLTEILTPHFLGREQEALVGLSEAVLDEAQLQTDEGVGGLQAQIDMLRSEYGAGLVGIEDLAGHFSSFNVEGALAELAANTGNFDPDSSYTITAPWTFTQSVSFDAPPLFSEGELVYDGNTIELPAQAGTLALLSDVPAPVNIQAGNGIDVSGVYPNYTITNTIPQLNLIAGSNVNITGTYPNLTISATGGGGGTGVTTINGMVGDVVLDYADVGAAAASHTHTIGQVAGLQAALGGKADSSHTHTIGQVAGLQAALGGKADSSHTHSANDITSGVFSTARLGTGTADNSRFLRGDGTWAEPPSGGGGGGTVTSVNVSGGTGISAAGGPITVSGTISLALSTNLQSWSGISPSSKANTSHTHTIGNITGLQDALDGKAESSHNHSASNITSGTLNAARIPNLDASKITAGTFSADRIPSLAASKITSGTFSTARIPDLSSSYVNTSSNQTGIAGNKTFTGNITAANLTATSDTRLKYDITRKEPRQELLEFIKLYGWKWIHSKEEGLGVLAQDVQKVAPEYVFEGDDGMLSVDKAGLAIEMVMAMMEKMNGSSD